MIATYLTVGGFLLVGLLLATLMTDLNLEDFCRAFAVIVFWPSAPVLMLAYGMFSLATKGFR